MHKILLECWCTSHTYFHYITHEDTQKRPCNITRPDNSELRSNRPQGAVYKFEPILTRTNRSKDDYFLGDCMWLPHMCSLIGAYLVLGTVPFSDRFYYSISKTTQTLPVRSGFVPNSSHN